MKKILFLTDYAPYSKYFFRYALELAHHFSAMITLTHVYPPLLPELPGNFELVNYDPSPEFETQVMNQWDRERERLEYFAADHTPLAFKEVPLTFELSAGRPITEIVQLQKEKQFDLTIMGMNTSGSMDRLYLGNVASHLIDKSVSPLLLLPPTAKYHGIRRILFASDLREDDLPIIHDLLEWANAFQSSLNCLWIVDPEGLSHSKEKEVSEATLKKLRSTEAFQAGKLGFSIVESKPENFEKKILHAVDYQDADLVVMQTHRRSWWQHLFEESTTKDIAAELFVPLLIYNE